MKTDIFTEALAKVRAGREEKLKKPSPIPCLGYEINTPDCHDYDCEYPHAGVFGCEDCVVNGGRFDPRTGKRYRKR
jgi:hypothetical protein